MELNEVLSQARDAMTVKRVFGDPYEKDGLTVIPVARVMGGAGGGEGREGDSILGSAGASPGETATGGAAGGGVGWGMIASPAGVFVIQEGQVRWLPAVDINRIVFGAQFVAIVGLIVLRSVLRSRRAG